MSKAYVLSGQEGTVTLSEIERPEPKIDFFSIGPVLNYEDIHQWWRGLLIHLYLRKVGVKP